MQKEVELKTRLEEERRTLIQDAETAMVSLRKEKEELVEKLQKTEAEAYSARQNAEELRDEVKRNIDKSIQIESRLAALENENSRLKRSAARNEDERTSETSVLKSELKRAKDEAASARDAQHALESRLTVYEERLGQKEKEIKQLLQNTADLNVPQLEREIKELRSKLNAATQQLQEKERSVASVEELSEQVQQLKAQIVAKDERIQKLDKSKLTKDKVAALKKMKQENKETKEENEALRDKLRVAEQTLAELSATGSSGHTAEVTKLKFDKDALESKLRKYATHCQRLEEERDSVREVLRSKKVDKIDSSSIADIVVTLVDRLTSLEEECDALSRTESQASSFLVEIENLRQHNRTLQAQAADARRNSDQSSRSEIQLKETIRMLKQQVEASQKEIRDAQMCTAEVERKLNRGIQRLEHENLQILQDLKAKKEELAKCKAQLNAMRLRSSASTPGKSLEAPVSQSKENVENRVRESSSRPPRGSAMKVPRRRPTVPGLGEALEENHENTQECKQS